MAITFSKLRNDEGWGLRGDKASPSDQPPEPGTTITVTKRSGETNDVVMGTVIAQGDDWWLATLGKKKWVKRPPGLSEVRARYEVEHNTVVEAVTPPSPAVRPITPPYDPSSANYTERRLADEESKEKAEDEARWAEALASEPPPETVKDDHGFDWGEEQ